MYNWKKLFSKIAYYSFYIAVTIEVLLVIIDKSAYINPIEGRLFQISFLLFLLKVCLTKYTWKEYMTIFLFAVLGGISYLITGRNEIIRIVIFIASCKNIDIKVCLKYVFYMTLSGCAIIILLSVSGLYGTVALTQEYGRGGAETRYVLGMGHPNALQCMVWALTTLGIYLYAEKMKWYHYILLLLVNAGFFLITDSKTGFGVAGLVIFLALIMDCFKNRNLKKLCAYMIVFLIVFSIVISVIMAANAYKVYNYAWYIDLSPEAAFWAKLDHLFNGRMRSLTGTNGYQGVITSWSLFSTPQSDYYFDMGWVRLFYWYGIIPASISILVLMIVIIYCFRKKQYAALLMIMSFSVYSIIEAHAISVYLARNYVLFLIGGYWCQLLEKGKQHRL